MQLAQEKQTKSRFSYEEYCQILSKVRGDLRSFDEAEGLEEFTILRHDVEFSLSRALKMARIEHQLGVKSTFFIQVRSSAYNPFSVKNKNIINDIKSLGHHVGLHLYISHVQEQAWEHLQDELLTQKQIFEAGLGLPCDCFSFHRPPRWVLGKRDDRLCGLINAYGSSFFEFADDPSDIKYIADSKHKWAYGHPLDDYSHKKLQILIHPDEWSDEGFDTKLNFGSLIDENRTEFIDTLDAETHPFRLYREDLE